MEIVNPAETQHKGNKFHPWDLRRRIMSIKRGLPLQFLGARECAQHIEKVQGACKKKRRKGKKQLLFFIQKHQ